MKVKILKGSTTAKEINEITNPKMGKRHINYESMLRTFDIEGVLNVNGGIIPLNICKILWLKKCYPEGYICNAKLLENGKIVLYEASNK